MGEEKIFDGRGVRGILFFLCGQVIGSGIKYPVLEFFGLLVTGTLAFTV